MWCFRAVGIEPPNYPELWQCIGMIVGVYGIGYLAASTDPVRHWPIVLVGFLGKIFGPIGYADGVLRPLAPPARPPLSDPWWVAHRSWLYNIGRMPLRVYKQCFHYWRPDTIHKVIRAPEWRRM